MKIKTIISVLMAAMLLFTSSACKLMSVFTRSTKPPATQTVTHPATQSVTQPATPNPSPEINPQLFTPTTAPSLPTSTTLPSLPPVTIHWADDAPADTSMVHEFIANPEPQVKLLFLTNTSVKDFKFHSLILDNVDDDGKITFSSQVLYTLAEFTPETPLMVALTFYGDLPTWGISYVDPTGSTRNFSFEISGMDGSLLLNEY